MLVFAAGANGDVHPVATIRGSNTGLKKDYTRNHVGGLAVTPAGRCTSQTEMK